MQFEVYNIIKYLEPIGLTKLYIFGSSVTKFCHVWSDLDMYVEGCSREQVEGYVTQRDICIDMLHPGLVCSGSAIANQIFNWGVCL